MNKLVDLTGRRFGKLLALKRNGFSENGGAIWKCECDCGNEKDVLSANLLNGSTKSCGCARFELQGNLIGKKFGRLLVIEKGRMEKRNTRGFYTFWVCECDCGNKKEIRGDYLRGGGTISCGCYANEIRRKNSGESNLKYLYGHYKRGAKIRNLSFSISLYDFKMLTSSDCIYCGIPPKQVMNRRDSNGAYIYNGIDRVDSSKGYAIENCVPCCGRCNEAKMSEKQEDFKSWIEKVYNHFVKNN